MPTPTRSTGSSSSSCSAAKPPGHAPIAKPLGPVNGKGRHLFPQPSIRSCDPGGSPTRPHGPSTPTRLTRHRPGRWCPLGAHPPPRSYNRTMLPKKITLADLRAVRASGNPMAMLTCYDYTTARLMHESGVPLILVGDSAANVILGHETTLPVSLSFMIEITAAARRGAPNALLIADMPFGSYHASVAQGVRNVARMIKRTGCDAVKLEVSD